MLLMVRIGVRAPLPVRVTSIIERLGRAEALEIFRRGIGVEFHREQLALNEVGLRRLAQTDRDVRLAHRQIELLVAGDQRDVDIGIEVDELAEPRSEPMQSDAGRGRYLELSVRPLLAIGELGARGFELHEHVVRGVVQELALLGEDEPACVPMEQRNPELLLERRHLPRHCRLREAELLAGMGEAAGLRGGVEILELVPVHARRGSHGIGYSAATAGSASPSAARKGSDSIAAMHPWPAAVTAWR